MASVAIRFKDNDDGTVSVTMKFYPPIETKAMTTPAQNLAFKAMGILKNETEVNDERQRIPHD